MLIRLLLPPTLLIALLAAVLVSAWHLPAIADEGEGAKANTLFGWEMYVFPPAEPDGGSVTPEADAVRLYVRAIAGAMARKEARVYFLDADYDARFDPEFLDAYAGSILLRRSGEGHGWVLETNPDDPFFTEIAEALSAGGIEARRQTLAEWQTAFARHETALPRLLAHEARGLTGTWETSDLLTLGQVIADGRGGPTVEGVRRVRCVDGVIEVLFDGLRPAYALLGAERLSTRQAEVGRLLTARAASRRPPELFVLGAVQVWRMALPRCGQ